MRYKWNSQLVVIDVKRLSPMYDDIMYIIVNSNFTEGLYLSDTHSRAPYMNILVQ